MRGMNGSFGSGDDFVEKGAEYRSHIDVSD